MTFVKFTLPGAAVSIINDGNWQNDCPDGYTALQSAPRRRTGSGYRVEATMDRLSARDLAEYLESVDEILSCMTGDERGKGREHLVARDAALRIRAAIAEVQS